jgi:hypothetical protein
LEAVGPWARSTDPREEGDSRGAGVSAGSGLLDRVCGPGRGVAVWAQRRDPSGSNLWESLSTPFLFRESQKSEIPFIYDY